MGRASKLSLLPALVGLIGVASLWHAACSAFAVLTQPKRPPSSYMLWLSENRASIAKELGTAKVPEVAKKAGADWSKLSEKQKKRYAEKAAVLKAGYEKEKEQFLLAGGVIARKERDDSTKASRRKKDPNAPKRPLNAYLLWLGDNRAKIGKALPEGHKVSDVAKAGGEKWKKATAATKKKYEDRAQSMREEYSKELQAYRAKIA